MAGEKVVVTTKHRGVFFGEIVKREGTTIWLRNCRNCLRWSADINGFLGLAATGPNAGCKIGAVAPETELLDVTSVSQCTPQAIAAWEAA